jgi:AcrR family transcriptional regulator
MVGGDKRAAGGRKAVEAASTRDRLIDAAFATVARLGLEGASVKAIAAEAGVAPGLLHYHFPTRDALLEAALRRELEAYVEASRRRREATPPQRQIDALFESGRAAVSDERNLFRVRLAFAVRALSAPELSATVADLNRAASEEIALALAASQNRAKPTKADRATAAFLKAAFEGVMLAALNDPDFPVGVASDALKAAVRSRLEG